MAERQCVTSEFQLSCPREKLQGISDAYLLWGSPIARPKFDQPDFGRTRAPTLAAETTAEVPTRAEPPDCVGTSRIGSMGNAGAAKCNSVQTRALGGPFRAKIRLIELRAGHGKTPESISYRELCPRHAQASAQSSPSMDKPKRLRELQRPAPLPEHRRRTQALHCREDSTLSSFGGSQGGSLPANARSTGREDIRD